MDYPNIRARKKLTDRKLFKGKKMANIGFIGLGNMGGPMATHLINADHQVKGFDVVPNCVGKFAGYFAG